MSTQTLYAPNPPSLDDPMMKIAIIIVILACAAIAACFGQWAFAASF